MKILNIDHIPLRLTNTYATQLPELGTRMLPQTMQNAKWLVVSDETSGLLGLSSEQVSSATFLSWLAGQTDHSDALPIAQKYAGHQFGQFNPDLGDGRGILLAEAMTEHGRFDIHVKGAGRTPYSRFGDGKAVLRSCIREYLGSEALHHLGIPTSRALGIFTTSEKVMREQIEPGAVLVRVCPSHIRFGHFEHAFYQNNTELLKQLVNYTYHFVLPNLDKHCCANANEQALAVLEFACKSTAEMVAKWQAFGFCHGVMNTDNMSILGITFDYGPFGFLDQFDPTHICNHSDHSGRYAYDEQPGVALWNLNALAHALSPLIEKALLQQALAQYEPLLLGHYSQLMRAKLGLANAHDDDRTLSGQLLALMQQDKRDYTITWRLLTDLTRNPSLESWRNHFIDREKAESWWHKYQQRLALETTDAQQRYAIMAAHNPKYILRNYLAQQAIEQAEQGNITFLTELMMVLKTPFAEQPEFSQFAAEPPAWSQSLSISCSS